MTKADASINQASRQQAIDWLVEWRSGTMSDTQREALDRWCAANPAHAAERGLPEANDSAVLAAMVADPILIERPLVETDKGVRLCRPQDIVLEIL